ncbi:MAG: hypothetical protein ABT940_02735 [Alphaproteobacteria bacterium]
MSAKSLMFPILMITAMLCGVPREVLAGGAPVLMIMQVSGKVEVSKDGSNWAEVTRNKFLFAGDSVRTGADGGGKLVNQASNMSQALSPNTVVKVGDAEASVVSGSLSAPEAVSGDLVAGLGNRFAEAQRYTTVRRSVDKDGQKVTVAAASQVTLSDSYPEMAWQGLGKDYSYMITVDGKGQPVAASGEEIVRHRLSGLTPGRHKFRLAVLKDGKSVAETEKDGEILWLSADEDKAVKASEQKIRAVLADDDFSLGNFFDSKGMSVVAMDHFRKYFTAHKEDNDMRPMLIKTYHDLKMKGLKSAEAQLYNEMVSKN